MSQPQLLPSPTTTQIALRFVADLQAGRRPSIEAALDAAPSSEWAGLLQSLLIAEINYRRSQGESPVAREYLPRFPAHSSVVRSVISDAPPVAQSAPSLPPIRPAVAVAMPVAVGQPIYTHPPMAIVLTDEFADIEPPPDPRAARIRRRRRRRLLAAAILLILLAGAAVPLSLPYLRKRENREPALPPQASQITTAPKRASPFEPKREAVDPERELAEWIVSVGGQGTVLMDAGGRRPFGPTVPLPKAKFTVAALVLPDGSSGRWAAADLGRLKNRDKLTSVELHHPSALSDWVLEVLAGSPLKTLALYGTAVGVTGAGIARFQELESLTVLSAASFSDADMAAIGKLKKLMSLTLNAPKLTPAGLNELKRLPLRSLVIGDRVVLTPEHVRILQWLPLEEFESRNGMTDDAVLEFAIFQSIKKFRVQRTSITDAGLKVFRGFGMLEELQITESSIAGPGLENLNERKKLKVLDLTGGKVDDQGLENLLALTSLQELRLAGCSIHDRGVMLLAQLDGLQVLDLSRTSVTDAALAILKKHPTLKSLIVTDTRVTAAGVNDFQKGTPNCKVVMGAK